MSTISISNTAALPAPLPLAFNAAAYDKTQYLELPSWDLSPRQLSDLELLENGAFRQLDGFMTRTDYDSVIKYKRLADGRLWPIPITLDVSEKFAMRLSTGSKIGLRDSEGVLLATLDINDIWQPDRQAETQLLYMNHQPNHQGNPVYIGGQITHLQSVTHHDFMPLRTVAADAQNIIDHSGLAWSGIFFSPQCGEGPARALLSTTRTSHEAMWVHIVSNCSAVHNWAQVERIRRFRHLSKLLGDSRTKFGIIPLWSRNTGDRDVLWQALINKNYGSSHFIINTLDNAIKSPAQTAAFLKKYQDELAMDISLTGETNIKPFVAVSSPHDSVTPGRSKNLTRQYNPSSGVTIFFTGLSGAGKSTIANVLVARLMESATRPVTLLDGDIVRKNLSSELGFSREHRDLNVLRIGYVASEITKHGGIAVCAPIAPYATTRMQVREMIAEHGGFYEVHVATSLEICESRDRKGLYAKARAGLIKEFTGISDPYEIPAAPEITLYSHHTPQQAADIILSRLVCDGYLTLDQEEESYEVF